MSTTVSPYAATAATGHTSAPPHPGHTTRHQTCAGV